jgi:anthranilate phosphoribosyltransferase
MLLRRAGRATAGAARDIVMLNAGVALYAANVADSMLAGGIACA